MFRAFGLRSENPGGASGSRAANPSGSTGEPSGQNVPFSSGFGVCFTVSEIEKNVRGGRQQNAPNTFL